MSEPRWTVAPSKAGIYWRWTPSFDQDPVIVRVEWLGNGQMVTGSMTNHEPVTTWEEDTFSRDSYWAGPLRWPDLETAPDA